jgi:hypothetical protein
LVDQIASSGIVRRCQSFRTTIVQVHEWMLPMKRHDVRGSNLENPSAVQKPLELGAFI